MKVLGVVFILIGTATGLYFMAVVGCPNPNTDDVGAFAAGLALVVSGIVFFKHPIGLRNFKTTPYRIRLTARISSAANPEYVEIAAPPAGMQASGRYGRPAFSHQRRHICR